MRGQLLHIDAFGQRRHLSDWARVVKLPMTTIRKRLLLGWQPERALSDRPKPRRAHGRGSVSVRRGRPEVRMGDVWLGKANSMREAEEMVRCYRKIVPARGRPGRRLTIGTHARTAKEWAAISGVSHLTILRRIRQGWQITEAVFARPEAHRPAGAGSVALLKSGKFKAMLPVNRKQLGMFATQEEAERAIADAMSRGEHLVPRAKRIKLTARQASDIRRSRKSITTLARQYGVCWSCVFKVKKGITWKGNKQ